MSFQAILAQTKQRVAGNASVKATPSIQKPGSKTESPSSTNPRVRSEVPKPTDPSEKKGEVSGVNQPTSHNESPGGTGAEQPAESPFRKLLAMTQQRVAGNASLKVTPPVQKRDNKTESRPSNTSPQVAREAPKPTDSSEKIGEVSGNKPTGRNESPGGTGSDHSEKSLFKELLAMARQREAANTALTATPPVQKAGTKTESLPSKTNPRGVSEPLKPGDSSTKNGGGSGQPAVTSKETHDRETPSVSQVAARISMEVSDVDMESDDDFGADDFDFSEELHPKQKKKETIVAEKKLSDPVSYATVDQALTKFEEKLTVVVCGSTGAGKSSLINCYFGQYLAKTDTGKAVTMENKLYEKDYAKLRLLDTVGLEKRAGQASQIMTELIEYITSPTNHVDCCWFCTPEKEKLKPQDMEFIAKINQIVPVIILITRSEEGQLSGSYFKFTLEFEPEIPVVVTCCVETGPFRYMGGKDLQYALRRVLVAPQERIARLERIRDMRRLLRTLYVRVTQKHLKALNTLCYDDDLYLIWPSSDKCDLEFWKKAKKIPLIRACAQMSAETVCPFICFLVHSDVVATFLHVDIHPGNVSRLIDRIVNSIGSCFSSDSQIRKMVIPHLSRDSIEGLTDPKKPIKDILYLYLVFRQSFLEALASAIELTFGENPSEIGRFAPDTEKLFGYFELKLFLPDSDILRKKSIWSGCRLMGECEVGFPILETRLAQDSLPLGYLNGFIAGRDGDAYKGLLSLLVPGQQSWTPGFPIVYKRAKDSWLGLYLAKQLDWHDEGKLKYVLEQIRQEIASRMVHPDTTRRIHFFWYCCGLNEELRLEEKQILSKIKEMGIPVIITYGNVQEKLQSKKLKLQRVNTRDRSFSKNSFCLSVDAITQEIEKNVYSGSMNAIISTKYAAIQKKCDNGILHGLVEFFGDLAQKASVDKKYRRTFLLNMFKCLRDYTRVDLEDHALDFMSHFMGRTVMDSVLNGGDVFVEIIGQTDGKCPDVDVFQRLYIPEAQKSGLLWTWDD